jgi:hypothetical protein
MTKKRFSSEELYRMRNDIPIEGVIKEALDIPCRNMEGCFRFLCPVCNEFNTAVNPTTNLARCFCCEKNFNAIDLVMLINQMDFVESIRFLKRYQTDARNLTQLTKRDSKVRGESTTHIGNILKSFVTTPASASPSAGSDDNLCNRILALEQKLILLEQRIEELSKSFT